MTETTENVIVWTTPGKGIHHASISLTVGLDRDGLITFDKAVETLNRVGSLMTDHMKPEDQGRILAALVLDQLPK